MTKGNSRLNKTAELIYVIAGKNDSLVGAQCSMVINELLAPLERSTGLLTVDGDEASAANVLDELRTAPFLTKKRVVLIKNADSFISKNRELLEKYFDNPCATGVLVLAVSSWPSQTRLAKKLPEIGKLISVTQPKPWQLPQRLSQYARDAHDRVLEKQAAELLVDLVGDDLARLYSEIDKLALFVGDEKNIRERDIELLIGHNRIFGAFEVIDRVTADDIGTAVDRLRRMFAEDRTAEYMVVGAFAFHLRKLFEAKVLLGMGVSIAEVTKRLRIWSNKDRFFSQIRRMSLAHIGNSLQKLAEIDYAIKTGRTRVPIAMEQFVLGLIAESQVDESVVRSN